MSTVSPSRLNRHHVGDVADLAGHVVVTRLVRPVGSLMVVDDRLGTVAELGAIAALGTVAEFGRGGQVQAGRHGTVERVPTGGAAARRRSGDRSDGSLVPERTGSLCSSASAKLSDTSRKTWDSGVSSAPQIAASKLRGRLLLAAFDFGQVAQRHPGGGGHLAEGTTLAQA